ncbi:MAG: hypothetical protein R3B06_03160 [Kofleriaceae bacterium]
MAGLDLEAFRRAMFKRGFRQSDPLLHPCPACKHTKGVEKWVLAGRTGGRDVDVCMQCSKVTSWRHRPLENDREEDPAFDPASFLK